MITLELTENEAIRILAVMEVHLSELLKSEKTNQYQPMLRAVVQDGCIIGNLRETLGLPEYAAEIDKLEAKESNQNDSETMDSEPDAALR
jgi:endonuclease/exonuclease/phosphatase family metal-dependent hydrolase